MNMFGPSPEEAACAYRVAIAAEAFLNAYLEKRIKSGDVTSLIVALYELKLQSVGDSLTFSTRESELTETVFSPHDTVLHWTGDGEPVAMRSIG